jgi:hypothetical protein
VHPPVAASTVEDPPFQLPLQVALHLQQLQADELRLEDRAIFGEACGLEFVDQRVCFDGLFGHGVYRLFENLPLPFSHGGIVGLAEPLDRQPRSTHYPGDGAADED